MCTQIQMWSWQSDLIIKTSKFWWVLMQYNGACFSNQQKSCFALMAYIKFPNCLLRSKILDLQVCSNLADICFTWSLSHILLHTYQYNSEPVQQWHRIAFSWQKHYVLVVEQSTNCSSMVREHQVSTWVRIPQSGWTFSVTKWLLLNDAEYKNNTP